MEGKAQEKKISIIVPLYKNEVLLHRLTKSLLETQGDWAGFTRQLILVNDSPDYPALGEALNDFPLDKFQVECVVISNTCNLGFVGSVNKGLKIARETGDHALILNSDTVVFGNWLSGLMSVMSSDEKIGFVSPRSNNATIATYPQMSDEYVGLKPELAHEKFLQRSQGLPPYTFVPLTVGFCMLIRSWIIADLGLLDEIYGHGYNEENDYIMRANRFGMVAALANHVFVYHDGEASFSLAPLGKTTLEARNQRVFNLRYPESRHALERYYSGPRYRAELIWGQTGGAKPRITFDLTNLHGFENGTSKLARSIVSSFDRSFGHKYEVIVYSSPSAQKYHAFVDDNLKYVDSTKKDIPFSDVIVRVGQVFNLDWLQQLRGKTRLLSIFMLDPIAWDTQQTAADFDSKSWTATFVLANQLPSISKFSKQAFDRRFIHSGKFEPLLISPSLEGGEYRFSRIAKAAKEKYILVLGNKFRHKFVPETVALLSEVRDYRVYALGGANRIPKADRQFVSGEMSADQIEDLILNAEAIVFPSVYEGFGFPVIEALANGKIIFARDMEVNREISAALGSPDHLRLYETTEDLASEISNLSNLRPITDHFGDQEHSWAKSISLLEQKLATELADIRFSELEKILTLSWLLSSTKHGGDPITRLLARLEHLIRSALTNPLVFLTAKKVWTSMMSIRNRIRNPRG